MQRIADAARGWRGRARELECPAADGAAGGCPALGAAQTRDVPGPDDLEQDGPVLERTSGFLPGEGGDARLGRRGLLGERLATCDDLGGLWAREWHGGEPAHSDEARDLEARCVRREDQGHRLALRAQQRDVACARVGGELLGEALVAVVPHEHRAEVRCWGVDNTPRTDDDPGRLVETSEERRVAFGRLGPRVEASDACWFEEAPQPAKRELDVSVVGNGEDDRLPRLNPRRRRGREGEQRAWDTSVDADGSVDGEPDSSATSEEHCRLLAVHRNKRGVRRGELRGARSPRQARRLRAGRSFCGACRFSRVFGVSRLCGVGRTVVAFSS
ncbi:hypothetical protein ACFPRL_01540 [Pseudoclavibacter helvolus]